MFVLTLFSVEKERFFENPLKAALERRIIRGETVRYRLFETIRTFNCPPVFAVSRRFNENL